MLDLSDRHKSGLRAIPPSPDGEGTQQVYAEEDARIKNLHPSKVARIRMLANEHGLNLGLLGRQFSLSQRALKIILDEERYTKLKGRPAPFQLSAR